MAEAYRHVAASVRSDNEAGQIDTNLLICHPLP